MVQITTVVSGSHPHNTSKKSNKASEHTAFSSVNTAVFYLVATQKIASTYYNDLRNDIYTYTKLMTIELFNIVWPYVWLDNFFSYWTANFLEVDSKQP